MRFLVLVLAACVSEPTDLSFDIDSRFAPSQRDAILHAADAWNSVTLPDHRFNIDGGTWRTSAEVPTGPCFGHPGCEHNHSRVLQIDPSSDVYAVAMHELGHVLGLGHVSGGVMDPNVVNIQITDTDLTECRRVGACQ